MAGVRRGTATSSSTRPGTTSVESQEELGKYRDYISTEIEVKAVGEEQCSKPVSEREGPWVCGPEGGVITTQDAGTQCNAVGACWQIPPTTFYRANNWVDGFFGYGDDVLGSADMYSSNHLNGAQMRTRTYFVSDTSTADLTAEGDLLYGDQDSGGQPIDSQYEFKVDSGQAASNKWWPWGSTSTSGYRSYDTVRGNHANVIQYTWGKGGYPGHWWIYMKSVIATDPDNNNIYRFLDPGYRFWYSHKSGYHAY
jgi:hypothetical protein